MTEWTTENIPDQTGRVVLVTGANSGLGLVAAKELAAHGAYVLMACRDTEKGWAVRNEQVVGGDDHSEVRELDLADLDSVHRFADSIADWRIDVVINNAGVMNTPLRRTPQGHELQFGTNVLGHFALAQRLEKQVTDRFVWLGSIAHRHAKLDVSDLDWERRRYKSWRAYADSKFACMMLTVEQNRRFEQGDSGRRAVAAHPGISASNLFRDHGASRIPFYNSAAQAFIKRAQSPEMGALPELYAAVVPDLAGGSYVGPDGRFEVAGHPTLVTPRDDVNDPIVARSLWDECERMSA